MKLRLAKKISKSIGTPREHCYKLHQHQFAQDRLERTKSAKRLLKMWCGIMDYLGPEGRADLLFRLGDHKKAIDLLMRTPEEQWKGDPKAWPFVYTKPGEQQ